MLCRLSTQLHQSLSPIIPPASRARVYSLFQPFTRLQLFCFRPVVSLRLFHLQFAPPTSPLHTPQLPRPSPLARTFVDHHHIRCPERRFTPSEALRTAFDCLDWALRNARHTLARFYPTQ